MKKQDEQPEVTISGIVTASDWDSNNQVVAVSLAVDGEREYRIRQGKYYNELCALLRKEVEVTGKIFGGAKEDFHIAVSSYRVI